MIGQTNAIESINSNIKEQLINYVMLYDHGNECEDVTGGWTSDALDTIKFNGTTMAQSGTSEKLTDCLHMNQLNVSGTFKYLSFRTINKIDTNDFVVSFMKHNLQKVETGNATSKLFLTDNLNIGDSNLNYSHNWALESTFSEGSHASIISYDNFGTDLGTINGSYYIVPTIFYGVSSDGRYEISVYNITFFKEDDWQTLASLASLTASSIDELLTNSSTLLNNEEAVEFMIYNCTGEFMANAITSETFLNALNSSEYKTIIQANEHWSKFLNMVA